MQIVKILLAIALIFPAFCFRLLFWASWRYYTFWAIIICGLALIVWEASKLTRVKNKRKVSSFLIVAIASFSLSYTLIVETRFQGTKYSVLNADPQKLENLGQHFIVGYRNFDEIENLVTKNAIGGVFITARNVKNKTKQDIQQEIKALQDIRRDRNLPPLWIATDQEGGIVSRLSPPLTRLPQLSSIAASEKNIEAKKDAVIKYATTQAKGLAEIGVNVNFAPVVDLNKGIISPEDKFSKIYQRAISSEPVVVAKVALWYCQTLEKYAVRCTIKHFPGLGRVTTDTHIADAELNASLEELTRDDWVPFREVMAKSQAFTMLGHAKLTAVDPKHPVSFSSQIVNETIRKNWQHDGILITDDFSMQAVYGSQDGLQTATIKALNAGVDLILIAYDKDLYYEAIATLLKAEKKGEIDSKILKKSKQRLIHLGIR